MTVPDVTPLPVGTPVTGEVRSVNFFNGRLLTGGDLRREQDGARVLRDRLGLAVGDGVVRGLRVTRPGGPDPARPLLDIARGVAVNRAGRAIELGYDVRITLTGAAHSQPAVTSGAGFVACSGLPEGSPLTRSGVYVLTVAPAGAPVGRAPAGGLGRGLSGCDTDACAEGVAFRVVHLELDAALLSDTARRRNRLAQVMFGTDDPRRTRLQRDPFGTVPTSAGLLDDLRGHLLGDEEVPLACVLWTPGVGIEFVDEWSVRRKVATSGADSDLPELTGGRQRAVAEARLLQFQAELADLAGLPGAVRLRASAAFTHLPPAALLPLRDGADRPGFAFREFLADVPFRGPFVLEGNDVSGCLSESFEHEPIDLSARHVMWLYSVRQNRQSASDAQQFVLFTAGGLRYRGDARFDLGHWNAANVAGLA
jgi:hypothetical protein